jgi:hypothetical protein
MKKNQVTRRKRGVTVFSCALAVLISLTIGRLSVAAEDSPQQGPPGDVSNVITIDPGIACTFGVELSLTGKSKTINLPGDRVVFTSPAFFATLTNLADPTKQVTLNTTGAFHQTTEQDGSVVTVVTGRNLLLDPEAGFVLAIGNFSFVFDGGNLIPLEGEGQLLDVCAMLD